MDQVHIFSSERRHDSFSARQQLEGRDRLVVARRQVGDAPTRLQGGVLRTDAGVVEPGGDAVAFRDLPVGVLENEGARAVSL